MNGTAVILLVALLGTGGETVRTPDEILAGVKGTPSREAILEIFVNASEWDGAHQAVRTPSEEALVKLGADALPPILEEYIRSGDVRRRITLDTAVRKIGPPAARHLIGYLEDPDPQARRHAAYLLGDTSVAAAEKEPKSLGPFPKDRRTATALRTALASEKDPQVLPSILAALGKLRDPALVPELERHLADPAEPPRLQATIGLSSIPHPDAAKALLRALQDPLGSVRQAAILGLASPAIAGSSSREIVEGCRALPAGSRAEVACLDALTRSAEHPPEVLALAREVLEKSAAPEAWIARGYAVTLLGRSGEAGDRSALERLLVTESHPFVRGRIEEALAVLRRGSP